MLPVTLQNQDNPEISSIYPGSWNGWEMHAPGYELRSKNNVHSRPLQADGIIFKIFRQAEVKYSNSGSASTSDVPSRQKSQSVGGNHKAFSLPGSGCRPSSSRSARARPYSQPGSPHPRTGRAQPPSAARPPHPRRPVLHRTAATGSCWRGNGGRPLARAAKPPTFQVPRPTGGISAMAARQSLRRRRPRPEGACCALPDWLAFGVPIGLGP